MGNFPKFRPKNKKLSILTENWHTLYIGGVDSKSRLRFLKFWPKIHFWANLGPKIQSYLFCLIIGANILRIRIQNPDLDFWNSNPKTHFWANFGRKSHSCSFFLKIDTHGILTMLTLIPTIVFWIANAKSVFGQIWTEKVKVVCFAWYLTHPHTYTQYLEDVDSYLDISFLKFQTYILRMLILILRLVFWSSKPKSDFWTNLSRKTWILHFAWRLVHRVSGWCDWKNTEQGLEAKIKMINRIKCLLLLYLYCS